MSVFTCCDVPEPSHPFPEAEMSSGEWNRVELVVTSLLGMRGAVGYHTSVLFAGMEYYFNASGVNVGRGGLESHGQSEDTSIIFVGFSDRSAREVNSYDKLRKNCNSFSDCALHLLCGRRLPPHLRRAERLGRVLDEQVSPLQSLLGNEFARNQQADGFDVEAVIAAIDANHRAREEPPSMSRCADASPCSEVGSACGSRSSSAAACSTSAGSSDVADDEAILDPGRGPSRASGVPEEGGRAGDDLRQCWPLDMLCSFVDMVGVTPPAEFARPRDAVLPVWRSELKLQPVSLDALCSFAVSASKARQQASEPPVATLLQQRRAPASKFAAALLMPLGCVEVPPTNFSVSLDLLCTSLGAARAGVEEEARSPVAKRVQPSTRCHPGNLWRPASPELVFVRPSVEVKVMLV